MKTNTIKSHRLFIPLQAIALALLASTIILTPSWLRATPVLFPVQSMFGTGVYGRPLTLTAANSLYTDGVNLYAGNITTVPTTCTNPVVNLQPNSYLMQIAGVMRPTRFTVPNTTNTLNVASLITSGPTFWFNTNGFANLTGTNGITLVTNSDGSIALNGAGLEPAGTTAALLSLTPLGTNIVISGAAVAAANGSYFPFQYVPNGGLYATNMNGNGSVVEGWTNNLSITAAGVSGTWYNTTNGGLTWTTSTAGTNPAPVGVIGVAYQTNLSFSLSPTGVSGLNSAAVDPNISSDGSGDLTATSFNGPGSGLNSIPVSGILGLGTAASDFWVQSDGSGHASVQSITGTNVTTAQVVSTQIITTNIFTLSLTNNGLVWFATRTNAAPNFAAPNGSICTTTNGQIFVRSNSVWLLH